MLALDLVWRQELENNPEAMREFDTEIFDLHKIVRGRSDKAKEDDKNGIPVSGPVAVDPPSWNVRTINGLLAFNAAFMKTVQDNPDQVHQCKKNIAWLEVEQKYLTRPQPQLPYSGYYGA